MTGSILPSRACAVRSTAYFSSAWKVPSGSGLVTRADPRRFASASRSASGVAPATAPCCGQTDAAGARSRRTRPGVRGPRARRRTAPRAARGWSAARRPRRRWLRAGRRRRAAPSARTRHRVEPTACNSGRVSPWSSSSRATARWAGSTAGLPRSAAERTAELTACCARVVISMGVLLNLWRDNPIRSTVKSGQLAAAGFPDHQCGGRARAACVASAPRRPGRVRPRVR